MQNLAAPCCIAHGLDACGAGLFCAAFDGRENLTCYPERSRADGEECDGDNHCESGDCNGDIGRCRTSGGTCERDVGCAPSSGGDIRVCSRADSRPGFECLLVGDGRSHAPCRDDSDCRNGPCVPSTFRCAECIDEALCGSCQARECTCDDNLNHFFLCLPPTEPDSNCFRCLRSEMDCAEACMLL